MPTPRAYMRRPYNYLQLKEHWTVEERVVFTSAEIEERKLEHEIMDTFKGNSIGMYGYRCSMRLDGGT
jgi:hypothetical protein